MHKKIPKIFVYLDKLEQNFLRNNITNIGVIYRNYESKKRLNNLLEIANYCKKNKCPLFISNDLKLALKVKAAGVYIPAFNKIGINHYNLGKKNLTILGSAHNQKEIINKMNQKCSVIFIPPIFKPSKNKKKLGILKFNILTKNRKVAFYALGGINENNLKELKLTNQSGFAGIEMFKKKTGPKLDRFFKVFSSYIT